MLETLGVPDAEVDGEVLREAFFHLARVEERDGPRDEYGRFPPSATALDLLDPPLERLRAELGAPRTPFRVALTHDVDSVRRWTRLGIRGALARVKRRDFRDVPALVRMPVHKLRGTDPNWRFREIVEGERERGASSTWFVLGAHRHPLDGASAVYERLRGQLLDTLRDLDVEVGLHGSYLAAEHESFLAEEKRTLGDVAGQRYHFLRVDPHRNLAPLERLGLRYDSSFGYGGALGFRAGIARPFRPWDFERERPFELVELPLAVMDATLAEPRYLGLDAREGLARATRVLERVAAAGGCVAVLWHMDRFGREYARGWDRAYDGLLGWVRDRGGRLCAAEDVVGQGAA